jgi:hypothetical protein
MLPRRSRRQAPVSGLHFDPGRSGPGRLQPVLGAMLQSAAKCLAMVPRGRPARPPNGRGRRCRTRTRAPPPINSRRNSHDLRIWAPPVRGSSCTTLADTRLATSATAQIRHRLRCSSSAGANTVDRGTSFQEVSMEVYGTRQRSELRRPSLAWITECAGVAPRSADRGVEYGKANTDR